MKRSLFIPALILLIAPRLAFGAEVLLLKQEGRVEVRLPKEAAFHPPTGRMPTGTVLRTGPRGSARLRFSDGTEVRVRPDSEVKLIPRSGGRSSVGLFFGRVWSKVVRSVTGGTSFDVTSANAVAGVRGTEFEVGVAGDGSARVIVSQGEVSVSGEDGPRSVSVRRGQKVGVNAQGGLGRREADEGRDDWDRWMQERAMEADAAGARVARALSHRLHRRYAKIRRLRQRQDRLQKQLKRRIAIGAPKKVITDTYNQIREVTAQLSEIETRLDAGLAMFSRWGQSPGLREAAELSGLVKDAARLEAKFMDLVEEGTDQSEESMEEMMKQMPRGPTLKGSGSVKDDLF